MWRFLAGVQPPEKKNKTSGELPEATDNAPSSSHSVKPKSRKFCEKWRFNDSGAPRTWLEYREGVMFCSVCRANAKEKRRANSFVIGTSAMKLENIISHESSNCHRDCASVSRAQSLTLEDTPSVKALTKLSDVTARKMAVLFRNAHAIAKKARPYSDFAWMCDLDEKKGVVVGNTYRNDMECRAFVKYIAKAERSKVHKDLEGAKFCSVMADGSTDSSVKEEELVYVRFCKEGNVEVRFVGIEAVEKADSAHIAQAIKSQMDAACKGWEGKLVACATDGAAVMTGQKSGVVSRLRGDKAYILGVHCMAHHLELVFADAIKVTPMFHRVEELLGGLYTFYHTSPLNRANLVKSYQTRNQTPLIPTRIGGTRWVGHLLRALDNFLRGFPAIVLHLEQIQSPDAQGVRGVQQAKAKKFYSSARDSTVVRFCGFLHDILGHLSSLSASLQKSTITLAEASTSLLATQAVLQKYRTREGPMMKATSGLMFEGVELEARSDNRPVKSSEETLLEKLRESMNDRFGDISAGVVCATKLASFRNWSENPAADFGDREIDTLCQHFGPILDSAGVCVNNIPDQWTILKATIYAAQENMQRLSWSEVNRKHKEQCPDVLHLMDLVLSIPASTADCERGFNTMKQVKTDWRSNLTPASLSDLLMVQLSSPEIKMYDPSPAIDLWHTDTIRSRRPDFMAGDKDEHSFENELSEED